MFSAASARLGSTQAGCSTKSIALLASFPGRRSPCGPPSRPVHAALIAMGEASARGAFASWAGSAAADSDDDTETQRFAGWGRAASPASAAPAWGGWHGGLAGESPADDSSTGECSPSGQAPAGAEQPEEGEACAVVLAEGAPCALVSYQAASGSRQWLQSFSADLRGSGGHEGFRRPFGNLLLVAAKGEQGNLRRVIDAEEDRLCEEIMLRPVLESDAALAKKVGLSHPENSARQVGSCKERLASALVQSQTCYIDLVLSQVLRSVASQGGRPVALVVRHRFDETPMRARSKQPFKMLGVSEAALVAQGAPALAGQVVEAGVTQKILQRDARCSAIFEVGGQHLCVTFELWCPLQLLGGKSAEILYEALRRWEPSVLNKYSFERTHHLFVTDGDSAIGRMVREFRHDHKKDGVLHSLCSVHKVAACRDKPALLFDKDVSRLIHMSLFLHQGGRMSLLRVALVRLLQERVRILRGRASEGASRRRETMLDLLYSHMSHRGVLLRSILTHFLNGDWGHEGVIEHYCNGCCQNREHTIERMTRDLIPVLAGRAPALFPRHRWVGAELTLSWAGLLLNCHCLLPRLWEMLLASTSRRGDGLGGGSADPGRVAMEDRPMDALPGCSPEGLIGQGGVQSFGPLRARQLPMHW